MRDKQIEEMAVDLCLIDRCMHLPRAECHNTTCAHCEAEALYNAGYRKASDVAREIFEEIEEILDLDKITDGLHFEAYWGADVAFDRVENKIAELKKKYLGEDINAPTKESEGEG